MNPKATGPFALACGWRASTPYSRRSPASSRPCAAPPPICTASSAPRNRCICIKPGWTSWEAFPAYPAQEIGDCPGFGYGHGNDLLQCVEKELGKIGDYQETDTELIYSESRKVAGILSSEDGSYGSACVKAMTTIGMVSRTMLGTAGPYSGNPRRAGA